MTDTQSIKDRLDLVQLIQEYVPLKKAGVYWKACCPFHSEKSPSFMVHPERQFWHCFGCGKHGDAFSFVQEIEGLDFPEALKLLADRAGIKLENFRTEVNKSQKNRILEINGKAAYFYHRILLDMSVAKPALDYLTNRGVTKEAIEKWQIGYVPDQWELLTQYFLKKGIGIEDLVATGLTIKKDGVQAGSSRGYYDRFRGRIMFPIQNVHGDVVGFTGRVLVEKENSGGKYVNTPETLVYQKSRILYGLYQAKQPIRKADLTVMVEGQMDVIACHSHGIENVVASSGTALTNEQAKLLKRYSDNLAIAFDADAAGQNAAMRGIEVLLTEGVNIRVITIPEGAGKDADECLKKNPAVWFEAVKNATEIMEWYFKKSLGSHDTNKPKEKQAVANELLPLIGRIPYAVERDHWLKELANRLGADLNALREDLDRLKIDVEKRSGVSTLVKKNTPTPVKEAEKDDQVHALRSKLLGLVFRYPEYMNEQFFSLPRALWGGDSLTGLYESLKTTYTENRNVALDDFNHPEFKELVEVLQMQSEKDFTELGPKATEAEFSQLLTRLKSLWSKTRGQQIQTELSQAERAGDKEKVGLLLRELQELSRL